MGAEFNCRMCGAGAAERLGFCPRCGSFESFARPVSSPHAWMRDSALVGADELWKRGAARTLDLGGDLAEVFGRLPFDPCIVAVHGDPGAGKSTLLLRLSDALAQRVGPVIYNSLEEGTGPSLVERLRRLEVRAPRLHLGCLSELPVVVERVRDLGARWVIFDSLSLTTLTAEDLARLVREEGVSLAFALHATKGGLARGSLDLLHVADVVVRLSPGEFERTKSRYSAAPVRGGWSTGLSVNGSVEGRE